MSNELINRFVGFTRIFIFALFLVSSVLTANTQTEEESQDFQNEVNAEEAPEEVYEEEVAEPEEAPDQDTEAEENYQDVHQEEVQANIQPEPVEQLPQSQPFIDISNNPSSYSGNKSISIERSSKLQKQQVSQPTEDVEQRFLDKPCDPVVNLVANEEKRFDVLSKLAEEYSFDISMLETENVAISIEKNQPLSEVVESITRKMNVVMNFQTIGNCKRLVSITVLNDKEWSSSGSGANSFGGRGKGEREERELKYVSPKITRLENFEKTQEQIEAEEKRKEEYRQSVERNGGEILNDSLSNGSELNNTFSIRGKGWKVQKEHIPDMEVYVNEVIKGERVPNVRGMSASDRKEYMRLRREYQKQQAAE